MPIASPSEDSSLTSVRLNVTAQTRQGAVGGSTLTTFTLIAVLLVLGTHKHDVQSLAGKSVAFAVRRWDCCGDPTGSDAIDPLWPCRVTKQGPSVAAQGAAAWMAALV